MDASIGRIAGLQGPPRKARCPARSGRSPCPVAKGAEVFAERWTPLILRELLLGSSHFCDLHRGVPLMSRSLLSLRLKQLEEIGIVERRQGRLRSEYYLTQAGREFGPIIQELGECGQRWYRPKFDAGELDVGLLMWDMRRCVKADAFPSRRISVQFNFTGVPPSKRTWWLVSDEKGIDLCPIDPGFEVDLYVATDLRTMTRIFMGDFSLKAAIRSGQIELSGPRDLCRSFERWLGLSGFAGIENAKGGRSVARNRHRSAA